MDAATERWIEEQAALWPAPDPETAALIVRVLRGSTSDEDEPATPAA